MPYTFPGCGAPWEADMAEIAVQAKRRKGTSGLFNTNGVRLSARDRKRLRAGNTRRSAARFVFSWTALMLGLASCYVALFYVPSIVPVHKYISISEPGRADPRLEADGVLAPYLALFKMRRAYVRAGQTLSVQYRNAGDAPIDLVVTQCRRAAVMEVFRCQPVSVREFTVGEASGARTFRVVESGFYHFTEHTTSPDYRIIWKRG